MKGFVLQGDEYAARFWREEELLEEFLAASPGAVSVRADTPARLAAMRAPDMFAPTRAVVSRPDIETAQDALAEAAKVSADFVIVSLPASRASLAVPANFTAVRFPLPQSSQAATARVRLCAARFGLSIPPALMGSLASAARADLPRVDSALEAAAICSDPEVISLLLGDLAAPPWPSDVLQAIAKDDLPAALAVCFRLTPNTLVPFLASQLGKGSSANYPATGPVATLRTKYGLAGLSRAWKAVSLIPLWKENSNLLAAGAAYAALTGSGLPRRTTVTG